MLKSREAICNSIGKAGVKIVVSAKLRKALAAAEPKKASTEATKSSLTSALDEPRPFDVTPTISARAERALLEQMYEDKLYLTEMLNDRDFEDFPDEGVRELVEEGISYLDGRVGFWRQQNPLGARKTLVAKSGRNRMAFRQMTAVAPSVAVGGKK